MTRRRSRRSDTGSALSSRTCCSGWDASHRFFSRWGIHSPSASAAVEGDDQVDGRVLALQRRTEQHFRTALTGVAAGVRIGLADLGSEQGAHLGDDPVRDFAAAVWTERRVVAPVEDDTAVAVSDRVVEGVHGEGAAAERPAGAGELQRDLQDEVGALAGLARERRRPPRSGPGHRRGCHRCNP